MKHPTPATPWLLAMLLSASLGAPAVHAATTEIVSVDSSGVLGDAGSTFSSVSADGRYVAFVSRAQNLVPGDTNGTDDIFVRDRQTGVTERVSVASDGTEGNGASVAPALSGDGNVVAFVSSATNLVPGDTNGRLDVYVHDRTSGMTTRVSVDSSGAEAGADSLAPSISFDGARVVFASSASNLVAGDGNGTFDVFLRDRPSGLTARLSVDSGGVEGNGPSLAPRISADGLVVAFHSAASNLVAVDINVSFDVFTHDLATGMTEMASVDSAGVQGNFSSVAASVSSDGRFVAFDSDATNLVPGDTNFRTDVFIHDRQSGATSRVSVASDGSEGNDRSGFVDPPAVSGDGRFVAFASGATNLVSGDTNNVVDMFLHDTASGETRRVSVASDGTEGNAPAAHWPNLSGDGSVVVYASQASNLVPSDTNGVQDVFARSASCGNGVVDQGEQCDDGNQANGDCCTSTCTLAPAGSVCDDGDSCTTGDFCSAGACIPGDVDPDVCLDPMRCYRAYPTSGLPRLKPGKRTLSDVFQTGLANVRGARSACTSVDLDGVATMPFDGPRLACHRLRSNGNLETLEGAEITISNRFGVQTLAVYRPRRVCLAADVEEAPPPGDRDHYLCYRAEPFERKERLRVRGMHNDTFGQFESKITRAVELCVPASVDGSPVAHPQASLVCYRGRDRRHSTSADVFDAQQESLHHLFGTETLDLIRLRRVCVPSEILEDGVPPPIG